MKTSLDHATAAQSHFGFVTVGYGPRVEPPVIGTHLRSFGGHVMPRGWLVVQESGTRADWEAQAALLCPGAAVRPVENGEQFFRCRLVEKISGGRGMRWRRE